MVEVLASPEEDKGGGDLSLVSTRHGVVHALEQSSATIDIADVGRRDRCVVDECVAECDVPGAHCVYLGVEVLTTPRQARVSVHQVAERRQRLRRTSYACGTGDQGCDARHVHAPCGALGEVLAEGVVELVDGRGCNARLGV
jgi:hypothetical protein